MSSTHFPNSLYIKLLQDSQEGVAVFTDSRCVFANSTACSQLGSAELYKGYFFTHFPSVTVQGQTIQSWSELTATLSLNQFTSVTLHHESSERHQALLQRISLEEQEYIVLRFSNAQQLHESLSDLEELNQELKRSSQAKDDFLASMSHELRTPLNAILGLSEALLESIYGQLNVEQRQSISQIAHSGQHLLALISDILDISKIRAGGMKLNPAEVDVESLCSEVVQQLKPEMRRKKLSFSLDIGGEVYVLTADPRWFKQLLTNLLSNAVKFTPSGKGIGLRVRGDTGKGRLRVTVWDEGIGVHPDDQEKLFDPFVQLDTSLSRAYQGTGLGLSIVSSVMELHGGEVTLDSELGKGSSFHLDFPWEEGLKLPALPISFTPPPLDTVLVVEDSTIDADKLKRYLTELGTDVIWDSTGALTINQAEQSTPELIMLDLHLPEASGVDLLKQLKSHPTLSSVPVVICSVLEPSESQVPHELIFGYLVKPFTRTSLIELLSRLPNHQPDAHLHRGSLNKAIIAQPHEPKENKDTILIVDDNLSNIQLIQDYLKRKGFDLLTAEDGQQALHVASSFLPDLILMDIQMPHMDGIEATKHLRLDEKTQHIPIFALTALAMPGDKERCLVAGMDDYFTKPVSLRELNKRITKRLKGS